jgi:orotate phosphoribosyltransferase
MSGARQQLLTLLSRQSFRLGDFKLSSGGSSDYYIDCRTTTLHAEGACLTARVFLDEIQRRHWHPRAIGGLTMGADPIVVGVAMLSGLDSHLQHTIGLTPQQPIHGFLVRKAEKSHGTGQRIEGFRELGARVVIVDDVCTTGASTVQAIEAALDFGFEIAGVMCLVERGVESLAEGELSPGRSTIEKAAHGAPFVSIFTSYEVRQEHLRQLA